MFVDNIKAIYCILKKKVQITNYNKFKLCVSQFLSKSTNEYPEGENATSLRQF